MAITYRELNDGTRQVAEDYHAKKTAVRVFRVDTRDPIAAKTAVIAVEGGMNSPFPGDGSLIVDSITARDGPGGVTVDVAYNYSSDRRASLGPRINKDSGSYWAFRESITSVEIPYPYGRKEPHAVGTETKLLWTIHDERKIVEPRTQTWVDVQVNGWDKNSRDTVLSQTNKLHDLGFTGVLWLFRGAEISPRTDSSGGARLYNVTYTWLGDPGTDVVIDFDPTKFAYPIQRREPFHEWTAFPSDLPEISPPDFYIHQLYTAEPDGWLNLPGIPPL